MRQTSRARPLVSILEVGVAAILLLIPFHATLSVWLSTVFGHYTALRLWKEYVLIVMAVIALSLTLNNRQLRQRLRHSWLFWLTIGYILLTLLLGFISLASHHVDRTAFGYAVVVNLRLVVFFWVCAFVASQSNKLHRNWQKLLLFPAVLVVLFGLFQHFVLSSNFLSHLGYGPHTIAPFETVDQNNQYVRIQSTLRGPNPLGAYLVVIITAVSILFFGARKRLKRWTLAVYGLVATAVLFYTYSRSAWIGVVLAVALSIWLSLLGRRGRWLGGALIAIVIIGSAAAYLSLRHNLRFENTFLHTSTRTRSVVSSDQNHEGALVSGIKDIIHQPLGRGPGTAGPASVYNNHPARIPENYYVQIGQEVGVLGVAVFITINVLIARVLWHNRHDRLSLLLLCSLIGISVVNLVSLAWTDDTLAYLWWGLAGIASGSVILGAKESSGHETQKTQKKTAL